MTEYLNTMLISPTTIKSTGDLNLNVDDSVMGASIRVAQNVYLQDVIGTTLLHRLQELVYNAIQGNEDNINETENEPYKTLLDDYLKNVLTYKVCSEICVRISLKIRNAGVVQTNDVNINGAVLSDIKYLKNIYETYYCDALNRMTDYLKENKSSFVELEECNCGRIKPKLNVRYANTGLFLGK